MEDVFILSTPLRPIPKIVATFVYAISTPLGPKKITLMTAIIVNLPSFLTLCSILAKISQSPGHLSDAFRIREGVRTVRHFRGEFERFGKLG